MNVDKARTMRLGFDGYCRVLRSIVRRPATTAELCERFGVYRRTMLWICGSMLKAGLIHRSEWVQPAPRRMRVPVWSFGPGGDVEHPHWRPVKRKSGESAVILGAVRDALQDRVLPADQLAADLGWTLEHGRRIVRIMRAHGLLRVAEWEVRCSAHTASYAFGPGADAHRKPISDAPARKALYARTHRAKRVHLAMVRATAGRLAA
jgi:hypothetical protein